MKNPWFKFYAQDWASDTSLLECTMEARGTLIYLMCVAHEGTPYGYLANERGPFSENILAIKCGMPLEDFREAVEDLVTNGRLVADEDGVLYVPRMARDGDICRVRSEAGKQGGLAKAKQNPGKTPSKTLANDSDLPPSKQAGKTPSKPLTSDSDSGSKEEKGSGEKQADPPAPPEEPKSEFDAELDEVVRAIHDRHPAPRRCGPAIIRKSLLIIAKESPTGERIAVINAIDKRHAAWCASDAWTKEGGEYAKSLERWLAPTMMRYLDDPPAPAKPKASSMEFGKGLFQ
jgi:hypothetical protein